MILAEKLLPLFTYLDAQIGGNDFMVGNAFSVADISIGTMFVNFVHTGEMLDAGRWPKLAAYVKRLHARPSFKAMLDEESRTVSQVRAA